MSTTTFKLGGDLTVNRLGFGAMRITGKGIWGEPKEPAAAKAVLRRAVELGVNFIDTADSYGPEVSERLIAEALYPYPKGLVIATKAGLTRRGPDQWAPVARPEYLWQCLEMSLRRLRVDRIDLFQLHRIDPKVPLEDTIGAFKEMQAAGKIRHFGLSEVSVGEIEKIRKMIPVVSVQNLYNLGDRKHEDVVNYCDREGMAFIPWFPVAAGMLAAEDSPLNQAARAHKVGAAQVAVAWLLHRSPVMLPIPGTSTVAHLEENVAAASLQLSEKEWAEIEGAARAASGLVK